MIQAGRRRLARLCRVVSPLALLGAATAAEAQIDPSAVQPGNPSRPGAEAPILPPFAEEPPPSPILVAPPEPPAPPVAEAPGAVPITAVRIVSDSPGATAVPPRQWVPPQDPSGRLRLHHQPGQPLDVAWVQSQFNAQIGSAGLRPSTAVSLVQLVNRAFVTAGFINSGLVVPEQRERNAGLLELQLIYGGLAASEGEPLVVEWSNGRSGGLSARFIRDRFPSAGRQPLSAVDIERDFRLLSEEPGIGSINAALRPATRAGEASLHLLVRPAERFDVYVGAANDRSPAVGGEHLFAGGYLRNAIVSGDLLSTEGGLTRGAEDAQVAYVTPFFSPRTLLSFRGGFNNAAVIDQPLLPLNIRARERSAEARISRQLLRVPLTPSDVPQRWSPSESLTGALAFAYRRQKSFLLGEPFSFAPGSVDGRTEYKALRLIADYVGRNVNRVIALSVTSSIGMGGTQSDIPSIPNPEDRFFALLAQLNLAQRLNGNGLELRARLLGQQSAGTLYSGERLSIGGVNSVRGYRESLFLTDSGLLGTVELALPFSLSRRRANSPLDWGAFTASIFTDGAYFRNAHEPQPPKRFISSVGASLAWTPSSALRAVATYGHALNDVPLPQNRDLQDHGFHFRVIMHPLGLLRIGPGAS